MRERFDPELPLERDGLMAKQPLTDDEAAAFYEDPNNREPAERGRRVVRPRVLTAHVPVRFPQDTIEQIQALAEDEGVSVSVWIRRAVKRELVRMREHTA